MEGEQKRVFLVLADDEIAGIRPPKGVYFTKFLSTAQELWISEKMMKQKNPYVLTARSLLIPLNVEWRREYQRFDPNGSGRRRMHMSFEAIQTKLQMCPNRTQKQSSCRFCIYSRHCMERDRKYPCSRFQRKENVSCDWNMQEKRSLI